MALNNDYVELHNASRNKIVPLTRLCIKTSGNVQIWQLISK